MLEFISLQIRSCLREQEVSQTLSSETGGSHHLSQQEQGGILFQRQACPLEGPLLTSHHLCFPQFDTRLQMQMEQMLIEEQSLEQQKALSSGPPEDTAFDQRARRRLLKLVGTPIPYLQAPQG